MADSSDHPLLVSLKEKLDDFRGDTEVVIVTGIDEDKQAIKLPQTMNINEESLRALATLFGSRNVIIK